MGEDLVGIMLEGAGFEIIDIGVDASPEIGAAVRTHQPQMVGMSALLTTTLAAMRETVRSLEEAGLRQQVAVMVGAPVTDAFAEEINADIYAPDRVPCRQASQSLAGHELIFRGKENTNGY